MNRIQHILTALILCCACSGGKQTVPEARLGEVLPAWSEGCLDIHLVNSGNGECNFFILPDGTTLLVDAGEMPVRENHVPRKPNPEVRAYKVYSEYIRHFLPEGRTSIDWCAPSHFHIDHIGTTSCSEGLHHEGGFAVTGLTAVYGDVPFERLLDTGYPSYEADTEIPAVQGEMVTNPNRDWQKFTEWATRAKGMLADRFRAGEEQITLLNNREAYPDFRIFNFIANTYAWTKGDNGEGRVERIGADRNDLQGNPSSAGFHLSYGNFDFITAGDLELKPQNSLAYYYRDFVESGLDVFKANHHLNLNSWGSRMREYLNPRVIVAHITGVHQPDMPTLHFLMDGELPEGINPEHYKGDWSRKLSWEKDFFVTNLAEEYIEENPEMAEKLAGYNGHIVVRVAPGGSEYYVYMLDDNDFEYRVKSIHGPIKCR